jgi:hypothetical protein
MRKISTKFFKSHDPNACDEVKIKGINFSSFNSRAWQLKLSTMLTLNSLRKQHGNFTSQPNARSNLLITIFIAIVLIDFRRALRRQRKVFNLQPNESSSIIYCEVI